MMMKTRKPAKIECFHDVFELTNIRPRRILREISMFLANLDYHSMKPQQSYKCDTKNIEFMRLI